LRDNIIRLPAISEGKPNHANPHIPDFYSLSYSIRQSSARAYRSLIYLGFEFSALTVCLFRDLYFWDLVLDFGEQTNPDANQIILAFLSAEVPLPRWFFLAIPIYHFLLANALFVRIVLLADA